MPPDTTTFKLRQAIAFRRLDEIKLLLAEPGLVNKLDEDGEYPLTHAAGSGHPEVVRILLDAGADINRALPKSGKTPLIRAAWSVSGRGWPGDVEIVRLLVASGLGPLRLQRRRRLALPRPGAHPGGPGRPGDHDEPRECPARAAGAVVRPMAGCAGRNDRGWGIAGKVNLSSRVNKPNQKPLGRIGRCTRPRRHHGVPMHSEWPCVYQPELNMSEWWIPFVPFALVFAWLFLFGVGRRRACPDCNQPLPLTQSPFTKTMRQWFEGGYICPNCGCEADVAGRKVLAGTAPQLRSVITSVALLALSVVPAIVMLVLLFQR